MARESIGRFSRRRPDPYVLDGLLGGPALPDGYVRRRRRLPRDRPRTRRSSTRRPVMQLNRLFYLSTAPEFFPIICEKLGAAGLHRAPEARAQDRDREAVRVRPGLGPRAEPAGARGLRGVAGLPDRPLPRQGDRPEPHGAPVRQRPVRAGLEPQLHRPRPDHRGGGHRNRG